MNPAVVEGFLHDVRRYLPLIPTLPYLSIHPLQGNCVLMESRSQHPPPSQS
jgi:hypothetical protein